MSGGEHDYTMEEIRRRDIMEHDELEDWEEHELDASSSDESGDESEAVVDDDEDDEGEE